MKKLLVAAVIALGLFASVKWIQAMDGMDHEGGHSGGGSGAMTPDDGEYQKSMDAARKFAGENKPKQAEDAVNKALMYRPNDPAALALKARITKKIKNMTYTGTNEQGQQEYKDNKTGMIFVLIPGGMLVIEESTGAGDDNSGTGAGGGNGSGAGGSGDADADGSRNNGNKNRRELKVDDFLLSKYETPQSVWLNFMESNPSFFKKGNNYPVEQVSHEDCQSFCKKTDLRLPTWVEWEYSCRAGSTTMYFWGKNPNDQYIWYDLNSGASTHPVTTKKGNGFGLYNMLGNVMEWCKDLYKDKETGKADDTEPGNKEKYGMLRGGAWDQQIGLCQSASYIQVLPTVKNKNAGFRCAKDINKP